MSDTISNFFTPRNGERITDTSGQMWEWYTMDSADRWVRLGICHGSFTAIDKASTLIRKIGHALDWAACESEGELMSDYEIGYMEGESSGYVDWEIALDDVMPTDDYGPSDVASYIAALQGCKRAALASIDMRTERIVGMFPLNQYSPELARTYAWKLLTVADLGSPV